MLGDNEGAMLLQSTLGEEADTDSRAMPDYWLSGKPGQWSSSSRPGWVSGIRSCNQRSGPAGFLRNRADDYFARTLFASGRCPQRLRHGRRHSEKQIRWV